MFMDMRRHDAVDTLLNDAESERRCAYASDKARLMALCRRVAVGELIRPYPSLYARKDYWAELQPPERTLHMARSLALLRRHWVFAGHVAAAAHGLEHQWVLHDGPMAILSQNHRRTPLLSYIHGTGTQPVIVGGVTVTNMARTVMDCSLLFGFRFALPICDSALRNGVTITDILQECRRTNKDCGKVFRVLHYASPNSENGGESLARATFIELGMQIPLVQVPFMDPRTNQQYRADFVWNLPNGRTIVGEFDGQAKYVDPSMTGGSSINSVVSGERERQEGLKRAGVDTIFRFTFKDVMDRQPLLRKALGAGVPMEATAF